MEFQKNSFATDLETSYTTKNCEKCALAAQCRENMQALSVQAPRIAEVARERSYCTQEIWRLATNKVKVMPPV